MERQIVKCKDTHLNDLLSISEQTFRDAFESVNNPEDFQQYIQTAFNKEQLRNELGTAGSSFYFLYVDGRLAGYFKTNEHEAQTEIKDPQALELERIYVLPGYQGKGHGQFMLEWVKSQARSLGKQYLWLGVWKQNTDAVRFYESCGFSIFGEHPYYIGKDRQMDWLMRLDLITLP
ncbi:MAG: GNAT family N-acetyltransferase [Eudoraea sp.]|nr:GNAT family N-acetyltransferase [Eudoraea sp.]